MLSIVIPTKNEEKYIGKLLSSLDNQTFKDFEVIVADANSTDRTREIAKKHGAKVVKGGMPGPGRNRGAEAAKGEYILFLDSDIILPKDFIEKNYYEFIERNADVGLAGMNPISDKFVDKLLHDALNTYFRLVQDFHPGGMGVNIFAKKKWFNKVNGFDEKIFFAEDYDFVRKIHRKGGKFAALRGPKVNVSVRRLDKEGRFMFAAKGIYALFYQTIKGPMYPGSIEYEFAAYDKKKSR